VTDRQADRNIPVILPIRTIAWHYYRRQLTRTLLMTASCASASSILNQTPMSWQRSLTGRLVSQTNLCASSRISNQLLSNANSGASGNAATKIVMNPNCSTVQKKQQQQQLLLLPLQLQNLTIMCGEFVCLFVCLSICHLSYSSGAFCDARSRTPTAAIESLGPRHVRPHLAFYLPYGQVEGNWVSG